MISASLRKRIETVAARYPRRESALLPAIAMAQHASKEHFVPREDLAEIAKLVGVSAARAYGVQTYYTMFNTKPVGKYHLQVDTNIPATLAGAGGIVERLQAVLGVGVGETTPDGMFTLSTVEDLGSCGTVPAIQINGRYYENMTAEKTDRLVESLRKGEMPDWKPNSHFGSQCRILLRRRDTPDSTLIRTYVKDGGYEALRRALEKKPEEVVAEVKNALLRGRGGAGFPAGVKWGFIPKNNTKPVYLICNADEGEPGTFKDRQIMEFDPHLLIEGMAIAGYAVGSKLGFIYIRGEFSPIADILEKAVAEARKQRFLGKDLCGKGIAFDIVVHRGAGSYVCGEETALIESLEGKRGNPRLRPPFPAVAGLYGCPTIVNNVETLSCVPYILLNGSEAFKRIGTPHNYGPKLFGVSGHVHRPGVYEYPLGVPLSEVLAAAGGVKGKLKAVIVGGLSVPILTAEECADLKLDYDSCIRHGTMLGSGGVMVMNDTVRIPWLALRTIEFYAHESCGQCTPCREGSNAIVELLRRIVGGRGTVRDLEQVLWLCGTIKGSTLCPAGNAYAIPLEVMIRKFRGEFDAPIRS